MPAASSSSFDDAAGSCPAPDPRLDGSVRLVPLAPPLLEACLALDGVSLGGLWSAEQWRRELEETQRPGLGLDRGGVLVAMACGWMVLDELHITLVAVQPDCRRQGLGRRILLELLATGRQLGAERATLEVAADNAAALALYERCGFRTAGVRRRYYRDGSDALIQWRGLDDRSAGMPLQSAAP